METKHELGGRTPRGVLAVAGSAVILLCFWSIGGVGFAKNSVTAGQYQYGDKKVTICHKTGSGKSVTITISRNALPAHLRHGDTVGPCPRRSEAKQKAGKRAKAEETRKAEKTDKAEKARKAEKTDKAEKARKAEKTTSRAKESNRKGSAKKESAKGKGDKPAEPAASTENRAPEAKPDQPKGRGKGNGKEKEKAKGSADPAAGQPAPPPAPAPSAGPPDDKGNGNDGGNGKGRGKK
jgi:hypothetical protein